MAAGRKQETNYCLFAKIASFRTNINSYTCFWQTSTYSFIPNWNKCLFTTGIVIWLVPEISSYFSPYLIIDRKRLKLYEWGQSCKKKTEFDVGARDQRLNSYLCFVAPGRFEPYSSLLARSAESVHPRIKTKGTHIGWRRMELCTRGAPPAVSMRLFWLK